VHTGGTSPGDGSGADRIVSASGAGMRVHETPSRSAGSGRAALDGHAVHMARAWLTGARRATDAAPDGPLGQRLAPACRPPGRAGAVVLVSEGPASRGAPLTPPGPLGPSTDPPPTPR